MTRSMTALFAAAFLTAVHASAQTPQQHLEEARRLLHDVAVPADTDAAKRIATLQQDYNEFASDYLLQSARAGTPEAADASTERQPNWRSRYMIVESDLAALLGPANASGAGDTPTASLDPPLREQLQQIRTHLQTFYAATIQSRDGNPVAHTGPAPNEPAPAAPTTAAPQTTPPVRSASAASQPPPPGGPVPANPPAAPPTSPPAQTQPETPATAPSPATAPPETSTPRTPPAPAHTAGIDPSTALQLLDRVQSILDGAAKGESPTSLNPVGTSGTKGGKNGAASGKVTIDRALVDEIRAEIDQIKALLKQ
jgi:hypothetical protein